MIYLRLAPGQAVKQASQPHLADTGILPMATMHIIRKLCIKSGNKCHMCHAGCRVRLYCKGADSMIYARLAPGQAVEQASQPHLADMARQGLRTLCLGQRDIPDKEYQVQFVGYWMLLSNVLVCMPSVSVYQGPLLCFGQHDVLDREY